MKFRIKIYIIFLYAYMYKIGTIRKDREMYQWYILPPALFFDRSRVRRIDWMLAPIVRICRYAYAARDVTAYARDTHVICMCFVCAHARTHTCTHVYTRERRVEILRPSVRNRLVYEKEKDRIIIRCAIYRLL